MASIGAGTERCVHGAEPRPHVPLAPSCCSLGDDKACWKNSHIELLLPREASNDGNNMYFSRIRNNHVCNANNTFSETPKAIGAWV